MISDSASGEGGPMGLENRRERTRLKRTARPELRNAFRPKREKRASGWV
jgi:hypothetical protein